MSAAGDDYDLYDVLNVQRGASVDEVRSSFRDLSRIYHPDKQGGGSSSSSSSSAGVGSAFMRVHQAYRILSDDVLRGFYDRYGLPGVKLAEQIEDGIDGGSLALPEDRLKDLEQRIQSLLQRHEELRAQRLLSLQGGFSLSLLAAPGVHGTRLRRRYRLQYSSMTHSVNIHVCDRLRFTVGCASHTQGGTGAGAAKLFLAASSSIDAATNARASLNVSVSPEAELSLSRSTSPHCAVQQKVSFSKDGGAMVLNFMPWLSRSLSGSLGISIGAGPSISLGLVQRSLSSGHSARCHLSMAEDQGELGFQLKYKAIKGFSLRLGPSISHTGVALQASCSSASSDGLTKFKWSLRVRPRGASLKLILSRCGLRFAIPLELWPEGAGPLPWPELGLAVAIWLAPPLVLRMLRPIAGVCGLSRRPVATVDDPGREAAAEAAAARKLMSRDAARQRTSEEAINGLVIIQAKYGDPACATIFGPLVASEAVLDVTDCLMAKVRGSKLQISDAPKSSLLGFHRVFPVPGAALPDVTLQPVLHVWYSFGGLQYSRSFGERDILLLP